MSAVSPVGRSKIWRYGGLILIVLAFSLLSLDLNRYAEKVTQIIAYRIRPTGVELQFESPTLSLTELSSRKIGINIPAGLVSLLLDQVTMKFGLIEFLRLEPTLNLSGMAYGGSVLGNYSFNMFSGGWRSQLSLKNVDLSLHPQLAGLGIQGKLSVTESWLQITPEGNRSGEFHLSIKDGAKPEATKVNLERVGIPFSATIPAVSQFEVGADGEIFDKEIKELDFAITSSLGNVNGQGSATLSHRDRVEKVDLALTVALTDLGKRELGTILSLVSAGALKSTTTEFKAVVKGLAIRPTIHYFDVQ